MTGKRFKLTAALTFTVIALLLFLCSCGAKNYSQSVPSYDYNEGAASEEYYSDGAEDYYAVEDAELAKDAAGGAVMEQAKRYVIRNGSINLAVKDTKEAMRQIRELAAKAGGLISNSYIYEIRENQYGGSMTLRIPETRFEEIMQKLEEVGKATNVETYVDDITMQYVDLQSRLNNQIAQEKRLLEIFEMADTVEDILEVEKEIGRVRAEIESMSAQMNYLKDQVSYSTINVDIREESLPTDVVKTSPFEDFGKRMKEAFIGSINVVLSTASFIIIAIIALLPALIIIGVIVYFVRRFLKKRAEKKKAPAEQQANTKEEDEITDQPAKD